MLTKRRRINVAVAVNIFGWTVNKEHSPYRWNVPLESELYRSWDGSMADEAYPFCGSWSGMGLVVEEMRKDGKYLFDIDEHLDEEGNPDGDLIASFTLDDGKYESAYGVSEDAPVAVALAALRALGVAVEDVVGEVKA